MEEMKMKKTTEASKTTQKKYEYIVQWRWRCEPDMWHSVMFSSKTNKRMYSLDEAKYEIERLKREDRCARHNGYTTDMCGGLGVSSTHYKEYDIIGYRIRKREVIPWETVEGSEETVE
jgi:hypothetical protein